jgi:hypothetical protein
MFHNSLHRFVDIVVIGIVVVMFIATTTTTTSPLFVMADDLSTPYVFTTYRVNISALPNNIDSDISGFVILHTKVDSDDDSESSYLGYAGMIQNVETNLTATSCTVDNGCGVHVHSGTSCYNTTTQGGHYYNNITLDKDPWSEERYFTVNGTSTFSGVLDIGAADIGGRVFLGTYRYVAFCNSIMMCTVYLIFKYSLLCANHYLYVFRVFQPKVHSENGTRIGCGVIEKVDDDDNSILSTMTNELSNSNATSQVSVLTLNDSIVCYFGLAINLEPNLSSYLNRDVGTNCNYTNGCGVHIHNGTSCTNTTTQGGHYYGSGIVDPWLKTMYYTTDEYGDAYFTGCVETGISDPSSFNNRPFIVHADNGSRVSCGLLQSPSTISGLPPSPSSARPPSMARPPSSALPPSRESTTSHASTVVVTELFGSILFVMIVMMVL